MRLAFTIMAALALCAAPVAAQGKTKTKAPASVAVLAVCESFASGDVLAVQAAREAGWDASQDDSESPFIQAFSGLKMLPGIGEASLFALNEDYPDASFGYCRIDVAGAQGGNELVQALVDLPRYDGQTRQRDGGMFASLQGVPDTNRMLLAHRDAQGFVLQLSITTPKAAGAGAAQ